MACPGKVSSTIPLTQRAVSRQQLGREATGEGGEAGLSMLREPDGGAALGRPQGTCAQRTGNTICHVISPCPPRVRWQGYA